MGKRPPRKYADKNRTIITEEWQVWHQRQLALGEDNGWSTMLAAGVDPYTYMPEPERTIPEEGAWIIVVEVPRGVAIDFDVPPLSMWRARHHELNSGGVEIAKGVKVWPQQAVIATPAGDLHLWPHEYIVVKDPAGLVGDPDATLHQLGGSPVLNEDHMFYLMSRGISHREAVLLLFDQITDPSFVYVTFPDWAVDAMYGAGQPLHRHISLHPREKASA
ncbi:hypothetical protein QDA01_gp88 [Microbacterium phage Cinna]|uniref:Uncharacterized protein n=2 Tax=Mementomorivirus TaxID=2733194 RepID=A0A6B9LCL9_9CAUD|nr:hypothetical protein QDA00_gp92 [Microbacterium phage Matzah]YP_010751024.1 hypothetical protein QDA01_gp88 [Microbacterium phage Cinna]QDH91601.1 hypothetical protein PBI_CINNA_17 [Microbacterium phage Cinna]QHB37011.1 hypothetical protein SEA_MATZAH_18 [Microbacterium phage Matzah]